MAVAIDSSTIDTATEQGHTKGKTMTIFEAMGTDNTGKVKGFASQYKVAIPEVVARLVQHALADDTLDIADLLSDAPHSQRGRKALDPDVKAAKEAARKALKGSGDVVALMAAIEQLRASQA